VGVAPNSPTPIRRMARGALLRGDSNSSGIAMRSSRLTVVSFRRSLRWCLETLDSEIW